MVVVVADPGLVAGGRAGRLDAPDQAGVGERAQHVVDRLVGDGRQVRPHEADQRLGVDVRVLVDRREHRQPGPRHAQGGVPQHGPAVRVRHAVIMEHYLEQIKS